MADENKTTAKQTAITEQDMQAAPKRFKVPGLTGWYLDAFFDQDNVTVKPVKNPVTAAELKAVFGSNLQEVD